MEEAIGEKQIPDSSITAKFEVPYEPGELKAIAIENGKEVETCDLKNNKRTQNNSAQGRQVNHTGKSQRSFLCYR